jgi:hypothetical protein
LIGDDGSGKEKKKHPPKITKEKSSSSSARRASGRQRNPKKDLQEKDTSSKTPPSVKKKLDHSASTDILNNVIPASIAIKKPPRTRKIVSDYLHQIITAVIKNELEKRALSS